MFKDEYKRVRELGNGAYGKAYLVQRRDAKEICHVAKTVQLDGLTDRESERAQAEAKILQKVSHQSITSYVTSFAEGNKFHIIMEYANMGDLASKIKRRAADERRFSEGTVLKYCVQLAQGLEHIHARGILHRDIKSANIFLSGENEQIKIGDFGVSMLLNHVAPTASKQVGTPHYMAPEALEAGAPNAASDVWSMGVVLYEVMALKLPFTAESLPALVTKICVRDPQELPQEYTQDMKHAVFALLRKDVKQRWTLKTLLRAPRRDQEPWALRVQQCRHKLASAEKAAGSSSSDGSSESAAAEAPSAQRRPAAADQRRPAGVARLSAPDSDVSRQSSERRSSSQAGPQRGSAPGHGLEAARKDAQDERRIAKLRALQQGSSSISFGAPLPRLLDNLAGANVVGKVRNCGGILPNVASR